MRIDRLVYIITLVCVTINRALIVYDNYHKLRGKNMNAAMFKELSEEEKIDHKGWARENYEPFTPIDVTWHPEIQYECARINLETHERYWKNQPEFRVGHQ